MNGNTNLEKALFQISKVQIMPNYSKSEAVMNKDLANYKTMIYKFKDNPSKGLPPGTPNDPPHVTLKQAETKILNWYLETDVMLLPASSTVASKANS